MSGPRVGVFGGSFNPIHLGHLIHADEAWAALGLDRLLFVPAKAPPHKGTTELLGEEERFHLVRLALSDEPRFEASRLEIDREGLSYTIDSVRALRSALPPGATIHLLIGLDSLIDLPSWRSPDEILRLAEVVVFPRPGYDRDAAPAALSGRVSFLDGPHLSISSAEIRTRIREGRPYRYWLPDPVWRRIETAGHYRA